MPRKRRQKHYRHLYRSKTTPELYYSTVVPGHRVTPGRINREQMIIEKQLKKQRRLKHPWGKGFFVS